MNLQAAPALLLDIWDQGSNLHAIDQALLLVTLARTDIPTNIVADLSLGYINRTLIQLRLQLFGSQMNAVVGCSNCHETLQLSLDLQTILQQLSASDNELLYSSLAHLKGYCFRLPTSRDLAAISQQSDFAGCALSLLHRCCITKPDSLPLSAKMMDAISELMEEIDPGLDINCDLVCEDCGFQNSYPLDMGNYLWREIENFAKNLLREIHVLANSYGWSEQAILALTQKRRRQYISMVMA